jgi:diguanylate cyclase (GGDEF)-like protein
MTIKTRILLLALLAVASLLYILGARFITENQERSEKRALLARMEAAEKLSGLVHELQKERGISAGYLVNQSKNNAVLLDVQRAATDQVKSRLDGDAVRELENLAKLAKVRESVFLRQMTPADSFNYYTLTIIDVLDQINTLAMYSRSPALKKGLHAHTHLLYAKEYLGEIRAGLNEALSNGPMDNARISLVSQRLDLHRHNGRMFLRDAVPGIADAFRAVLAQPRVQAAFEIIKSSLSGHGSAVTAEEWFAAASYAIDQLREVEDLSMAHLRQQVKGEIAAAERRFLIDAITTLGVSLMLMLLAGSTTFRLLYALKVLVTSIGHTIQTKNFANRIRLRGKDEMNVISYNFNELLAIAESLINEKDHLASTDSLTGAFNRHKFAELFAIELQRTLRYGGGVALIMFDIDHFKHINDEFGHGVGDMVLKEVTQLVRDLIRATDVMTRWGGEEFMILVPRDGREAAVILAEKLRGAIENHCFTGVSKVTASFGVGEYMPGDTLELLCARVDEALYRAKHEGRNRICVELTKVM